MKNFSISTIIDEEGNFIYENKPPYESNVLTSYFGISLNQEKRDFEECGNCDVFNFTIRDFDQKVFNITDVILESDTYDFIDFIKKILDKLYIIYNFRYTGIKEINQTFIIEDYLYLIFKTDENILKLSIVNTNTKKNFTIDLKLDTLINDINKTFDKTINFLNEDCIDLENKEQMKFFIMFKTLNDFLYYT